MRAFRLLPHYGDKVGAARSPALVSGAATAVRDLLHTPSTRLQQYRAATFGVRLMPARIKDDGSADKVELYYNGALAATYTIADLPPMQGATEQEMFNLRIERDIAPYKGKRGGNGGTGKHQLAVKQILHDFISDCYMEDSIQELYEKIAPHLK